ncbi:MAG: DUF6452 family protein [Candidatus Azobacteroides sp.]|nr:DUF6452 family protein [Candidatus Azobacteroides sp.]
MKIQYIILIGLIATLFFSCGDTECSESTNATLAAVFYIDEDNISSGDSLLVYGLHNDSLLIKVSTPTIINFPLKLEEHTTSFVFDFTGDLQVDLVKDTVRFFHQNSPHFISEACGCAMFYTIDSIRYTRHKIDSIAVVNKDIINEELENIQIFF